MPLNRKDRAKAQTQINRLQQLLNRVAPGPKRRAAQAQLDKAQDALDAGALDLGAILQLLAALLPLILALFKAVLIACLLLLAQPAQAQTFEVSPGFVIKKGCACQLGGSCECAPCHCPGCQCHSCPGKTYPCWDAHQRHWTYENGNRWYPDQGAWVYPNGSTYYPVRHLPQWQPVMSQGGT